MRRGDLVPVSLPGAYGKPRPALIIQSDFFDAHPSVTVVPVTSELRDLPLIRLRVLPSEQNGLCKPSDLMLDKLHTVPRDKIGPSFGSIEDAYLLELERLLTVFLGLA